MRTTSSIEIINGNKAKKEERKKVQDLEVLNKQKEINLENEKKAQKLKEEKNLLVKEQIKYLENEREESIQSIQKIKNPVIISFSGDEALAGMKYVELRERVEIARSNMLDARESIANIWYILLAKVSGTLFFIFILIRLAGEERDLIASFTFIPIFRMLFGESDMSLFIDFFLQDIPLVTAISFLIAFGFKNYSGFFENETRTNLYLLFGFSILGLFLSSMLFAY